MARKGFNPSSFTLSRSCFPRLLDRMSCVSSLTKSWRLATRSRGPAPSSFVKQAIGLRLYSNSSARQEWATLVPTSSSCSKSNLTSDSKYIEQECDKDTPTSVSQMLRLLQSASSIIHSPFTLLAKNRLHTEHHNRSLRQQSGTRNKVRVVPYNPPTPSPAPQDVRPNRPPPTPPGIDWNQIFLFSLVGLNALVFMGWQYAENQWEKHQDPSASIFMSKNFLSGEINLTEGRPWTLLTSCISHESSGHFLINMISLFFMAPPVLGLVGPPTFLGLYFGAGIFSSVISMGWVKYVNPWVNRGPRNERGSFSHGASGSIYAVMSTFACLSPRTTFLLFFVIPAPAWLVVPGILGWDFYSAWFRPGGKTDSAGHLGGAMAGVLFWRFGLRGLRFG